MKEWDETKLNSWQPRRPSAALKRRIFAVHRTSRAAVKWFWGALAPTVACAALALVMLNSNGGGVHPHSTMTLVLSNRDAAIDAVDNAQSSENRLVSVTFDWTNHSVFNSSIRFTPTTNLSN